MEIGQKTILKTNNIIKSLIIHIDNKWLVFCVFFDEELISLNKLIFTEKKTYTYLNQLTLKVLRPPRKT